MKNKEFIKTIFTVIVVWIAVNWFKILAGIVLILIVFITYSYTQNNAQLACTQFGIGLDEKLSKQIEKNNADDRQLHVQYGDVVTPPSEESDEPSTEYKFRNGICYRNVSIKTRYGATTTYSEINSYIENAYTQEDLANCILNTSDISTNNCEKYYKFYDKIFSNRYGI